MNLFWGWTFWINPTAHKDAHGLRIGVVCWFCLQLIDWTYQNVTFFAGCQTTGQISRLPSTFPWSIASSDDLLSADSWSGKGRTIRDGNDREEHGHVPACGRQEVNMDAVTKCGCHGTADFKWLIWMFHEHQPNGIGNASTISQYRETGLSE